MIIFTCIGHKTHIFNTTKDNDKWCDCLDTQWNISDSCRSLHNAIGWSVKNVSLICRHSVVTRVELTWSLQCKRAYLTLRFCIFCIHICLIIGISRSVCRYSPLIHFKHFIAVDKPLWMVHTFFKTSATNYTSAQTSALPRPNVAHSTAYIWQP